MDKDELIEKLTAILVAARAPDEKKNDLDYLRAALTVIAYYAKDALTELKKTP